jgi:hypothetical protein
MKRITLIGLLTLLSAMILTSTIFAASVSDASGEITLSYPDNLQVCDPTFTISTTGVASTMAVQYNLFVVEANNTLVGIDSGRVNGNLNVNFTPTPLTTGEMKSYAVFIAVLNEDGTIKAKLNGKWDVTYPEPTSTPEPTPPTPEPTPPTPEPTPRDWQGCTPGYWRQTHHFDSWVPTSYAPTNSYNVTFGVNGAYATLRDAVGANGGGEGALARHAVAALLNAANPNVNYAYSVADIIAGVQAAYASRNFEPFKNALDTANNAGCPLN